MQNSHAQFNASVCMNPQFHNPFCLKKSPKCITTSLQMLARISPLCVATINSPHVLHALNPEQGRPVLAIKPNLPSATSTL